MKHLKRILFFKYPGKGNNETVNLKHVISFLSVSKNSTYTYIHTSIPAAWSTIFQSKQNIFTAPKEVNIRML